MPFGEWEVNVALAGLRVRGYGKRIDSLKAKMLLHYGAGEPCTPISCAFFTYVNAGTRPTKWSGMLSVPLFSFKRAKIYS